MTSEQCKAMLIVSICLSVIGADQQLNIDKTANLKALRKHLRAGYKVYCNFTKRTV